MHGVLETEQFLKRAKAIMSDDEREAIVSFISGSPGIGTPLGGGIYKVRIARPGQGKSGGYRTLYVYAGDRVPLILLTVFAKNEMSNLSAAQLQAVMDVGKQVVAAYGGKS